VLGVPAAATTARFDVIAQAPATLASGELYLMMQRLLAERFGMVAHRETRSMTAYVLLVDEAGLKMKMLPAEPPASNPFSMTGAGSLTGRKVTADMLATVLSNQMGRPVTNKTGLVGVFDFTLEWAPDGQVAGSSERPSLVTAIREQLGLRLVSQIQPVEVVVVDRVEMVPRRD
jgi:uncharacterized protein (TIGR03435 family)